MTFLDTNVVIGVMTRRVPAFVERMAAELALATRFHLSSIVLTELEYGVRKSQDPVRNGARLAVFMSAIESVVAFDAQDAAVAGDIRAFLERQGTPIGVHDILIAAQARRRNALLVTNNRREFDRVPGLMVTDWGATAGGDLMGDEAA